MQSETQVAETLINPFGEDDDDFELNRLIDRHLQVIFPLFHEGLVKIYFVDNFKLAGRLPNRRP